MSLSKNHIKLITSLSQKKYRQKHKLFVVEGVKVVQEFLNSSYELDIVFSSDTNFSSTNKFIKVTDQELKKISSLKNPNKVLAIFKIPNQINPIMGGLILVLDSINDPGNLGTIIRLCDWFGIEQLVCSNETVDCFNPKVVQASMGSLTRVAVSYLDLKKYLQNASVPIFVADMDGLDVYKTKLPDSALLVLGNEANGISDEIKQLVTTKITIPRFGTIQQTESLNVATASAILLSEFRR
jgi:TrmH family RNA methyltransferase